MTTRSTTDPAGLDAAACTAAVMAVRWASDTEWQDRPTILARALTAAAPHIRQAALLEACQSIKDYADEYAEWSGQQAWDRGYVAGMKQAAFDVAHSIRTPAIAKINPSAETNDRPQQTEAPTERRNVHCSNCGNTRGGPLGHETSECTWHAGHAIQRDGQEADGA